MSHEKQEADYTAEVDTLLPQLEVQVKSSGLQAALELIAPLEKRARGGGDLLSTSRLLLVSVLMIRTTPSVKETDMKLLCDTIVGYSKKHGQLKQAIARMVQLAMLFLQKPAAADAKVPKSIYAIVDKELFADEKKPEAMDTDDAADESDDKAGMEDGRITVLMQQGRALGDTGLDDKLRLQLIETLREVTEGKVFVEVERARVSRMMSDLLYAQGDVNQAADVLQDLAVETFGSLERREKVEFILEQMRLNMERGDFHRVNLFSRKIHTKFFEDEAQQDLKLLYYDLMIRAGMHDRKHLDVCKYYREVLNTPSVRADTQKSEETLRNVILFLVLAPYDNEQSDLMSRVETMERLDTVPEHRSLLKCFTTPELMRWPGIEALYGDMLKATPIFAGSSEADARWKELHARVVEHNIQVVSKYYTKIRLERLAQLLDLTPAEAEEALADLVVKKTIHARIDRPSKLVDFEARLSDAEVLNHWSSDMGKLLRTVEKVSHLVEKEWAIQRAGLVVKANE
ncbi:proteasome regulatory particle subunit [Malassezia japonica]|uniref:Proteasome regulatory particle subunit n=1 Tax=Malassezia japonica TaxID=223818 RepID=A0AAF0F5U7_9BASI|nr:proteasome regulatory particle subunit [Malassezia japonica]WFD40429.1 proteasome regulatory particle subunit [Malassezia japonica]